MVQEVGSIKQLKTLFPKVFNKNTKWNDGDRLQDVFPHEFRKIKDALKAPGTLAKLYKDKVGVVWVCAWSAFVRFHVAELTSAFAWRARTAWRSSILRH